MPVIGGNKINMSAAYAGLIADGQTNNLTSGLVETANIPFGSGVVRGTNAGQIAAATSASTADNFVGVAAYELNRAYQAGETFGAVADKDATILTMGVIWVQVLTAVRAGDPAFMGVGSTAVGQWSNVAGTGAAAAVAIPNAKFLDAAQAGGLSRLSLVVGG